MVYDQSLRKSYSTLCYILTALATIAVVVLGMWNNTGLWDCFLYGIVPLMPLVSWGIDLYKQHKANFSALNNLESLINDGFKQLKEKQRVSTNSLDDIQNFMYLHRKSSYLIPDLFYKINRKKNENAAYYGAKEICKKYNLL